MSVGTSDEKSNRSEWLSSKFDDKSDNSLWVDAILNKSEFVFTKNSFVDESSFSKTVRSHFINRVHAMSAASKGQSLHVSSLCSSKSDNVLSKHEEFRLKSPSYLWQEHQEKWDRFPSG